MHMSAESYLNQAKAFHGHLGPYLVLGLRMGLLATTLLKKSHFELQAEIHTPGNPPHSCLVDGIQLATGCTMGKGNITLAEDEEMYGIFSTDAESVKLSMKKEVLSSIPHAAREELEPFARALFTRKDEELFDVSPD
ncbi:MAG: formylmethanofuran dehydrogenase subunit E family protein [Theionarchaea archaeon]|nr:formylmethanofuran dehydrogenase subunit E family protein [Theionarchaea archaeon]MBU7000233.1 formylmethanofuran dehydrogenase subunit E family protein [Theionarchaea archaeon]MBU7022122.1 formylmethanofuran dehydrogenase subunit E family protein [Theionarchaea archaeon]MBU7036144.1 formylmethanofuran dehydrogenase subunit E family protein [Theionarchaea archaeon]MBU7041526.1 formylmethanofuran dehydrogenase subunit E family protein [Theionarchaea archaeon]